MSCLECGEYLYDPNQWVCDKCYNKLTLPWTKLSREEKIKFLKSWGCPEKLYDKYL